MIITKSLFDYYQKGLIQLANRSDGREFLGIDKEVSPKDWIVGITPNAYFLRIGRNKYKGIFRCYPLFAKKLTGTISKVEITRNEKLYQGLNKYQGLLHYTGLFERPRLFPQILLASPETFYAGAGDGQVYRDTTNTSWADAHDILDGNTAAYELTLIQVGCRYIADPGYQIVRGFLPFDTSDLPNTATITAGVFSVYVTGTADIDNDGDDYIVAVQTSQTSNTELVVGDYDTCGDAITNPTIGSNTSDISGIGSSAYEDFTLTATGRSWISLTSYTKLGLREGHDCLNHAIATSVGYTRIQLSTSEEEGTSQDPKLVVTYTLGPPGVKTINDLTIGSAKTINDLAIGSVKTINDMS